MSEKLLTWIDGGRLVSWLEQERRAIDPRQNTDDFGRYGRMVRRWRSEGARSRVHLADEFLCSIGVCLGEVPDEFYCEDPRAGKAPYGPVSAEKAQRIAKLRRLGWTPREVAAMVGVTRRTVERHAQKAAA